MEEILIRNLPTVAMAVLRARGPANGRSVEVEACDVLAKALEEDAPSLVDLLVSDEGADFDFEPEPLGLRVRSAELEALHVPTDQERRALWDALNEAETAPELTRDWNEVRTQLRTSEQSS